MALSSGLLLVDKDAGVTSFTVVRRVRRLVGGARAGHAGSLDPFATGLLPVCVGRATRLVRFVASGTKRYHAFVRFGQATDTDDLTGRPVGRPFPPPGAADIRKVLPQFIGTIEQRPPRYSAKHVGGRRAYRLARAGRPVQLAPTPVRVDTLRLLAYDGQVAEITCQVGPGTYVRALARDLGERLGGAAHLAALRRTAVGPFAVADAVRLAALPDRKAVEERLLDPLAALEGLPRLPVSDAGRRLLAYGRTLPYGRGGPGAPPPESASREDPEVRCAVAPAGDSGDSAAGETSGLELIAVVSATDLGWRPAVVWKPGDRRG